LITNKHEFPFAEFYFTGDQSFNIELRNYALSKGYSLSEYGLKHTEGKQKGNYVDKKFTTEKEIFEFLELEFIPPNERKINALKRKN
jgi:DNA polymerase/3'-5' exonuclease PolX